VVAGALAGFGLAGQAVVMSRLLVIYGVLALASFFVAAATHAAMDNISARAVSTSALQAPLAMYQRWLGHLDGRPCPSYPVCSLYAKQALDMHGPLLGSWLMLDRLIHEADDVRRGPWVMAVDGQRLYDPLHRNDFWLNELDSSQKE